MQAHEHHLESLRRHLQRLRQRLQARAGEKMHKRIGRLCYVAVTKETEKLEEKAQTKGGEAHA